MDRSRPWVRNLLHTAHHEADRIGQQLRLALDTHDPTRDGRRRHRIDPIDLRPWWNRPTSTDPPTTTDTSEPPDGAAGRLHVLRTPLRS